MTGDQFFALMSHDWRIAAIFYGFMGMSAIYISTENMIVRWITSLIFGASFVAFILGGGGLFLEVTGMVTDWSYTRFVWAATAPMCIFFIAAMVLCVAGLLVHPPKKDS